MNPLVTGSVIHSLIPSYQNYYAPAITSSGTNVQWQTTTSAATSLSAASILAKGGTT